MDLQKTKQKPRALSNLDRFLYMIIGMLSLSSQKISRLPLACLYYTIICNLKFWIGNILKTEYIGNKKWSLTTFFIQYTIGFILSSTVFSIFVILLNENTRTLGYRHSSLSTIRELSHLIWYQQLVMILSSNSISILILNCTLIYSLILGFS